MPPHSFCITGSSPEEIMRKLKEEHPKDWQDAIPMELVRLERRGLMRLFGKPLWKRHFVIIRRLDPAKERKIDELRQRLAAKGNLVAGGRPAEAARGREDGTGTLSAGDGVVRRIEEVKKAVAMLERPDFPSSILSPEAVKGAAPEPDPVVARWVKALRKTEMGEDLARELAEAVVSSGSLEKALERTVRFRGPVRLSPGERKVVMVVGPTGVGKTTNLVKVGAEFYRSHVPMRFMTIDTFRVGATAQLEAYAEIMNRSIDIVRTPQEYRERLAACGERLVFTDTAGRNPQDEVRLKELTEFLAAVPTGFTVEVYLVVSATTALSDLEEVAGRFGTLPLAGVIVTKMDEAQGKGGRVVEFLRRSGLAAAYLTKGQQVPEDIVAASPESLAVFVGP